MAIRKQVVAEGHPNRAPGHAVLVNNGDDGKVHITAFRRRGDKVVQVGSYSIAIEELQKLLGD